MPLNRIDLADIHEPCRLARSLQDMLGPTDGPVPILDIARTLEIAAIRLDRFDGFEGMLLTDSVRSTGTILANTRHGHRRARFTVAHELGHFLMERHVLSGAAGFTCRTADLRETRDGQRHLRQETEANRFAIEVLAPPCLIDPILSSDPDLRDARRLRDRLDISLEASVRRMIEHRDEPLAGIWSYRGRVRYVIRGARFPFVPLSKGDRLPPLTQAFRAVSQARPGFTEVVETHAQAWTGRPDIDLSEQTRLAENGHAVTLLLADLPDDAQEEDSGLPELGMPRFR